MILKIVPKAGYEWKLKKSTEQRKTEQKFELLAKWFLELVSVFKEASKNFIFIFLLNKVG